MTTAATGSKAHVLAQKSSFETLSSTRGERYATRLHMMRKRLVSGVGRFYSGLEHACMQAAWVALTCHVAVGHDTTSQCKASRFNTWLLR